MVFEAAVPGKDTVAAALLQCSGIKLNCKVAWQNGGLLLLQWVLGRDMTAEKQIDMLTNCFSKAVLHKQPNFFPGEWSIQAFLTIQVRLQPKRKSFRGTTTGKVGVMRA